MPKTVDFNFHIKPILVQKCYLCHGPDPSSREAGLRLDRFEDAIAKLESGNKAIVPGKPSSSELLKRVHHQDPEIRMPPPSSNLELSQEELAMLRQWIKDGAKYEPHWAFVPPKPQILETWEGTSPSEVIDQLVSKAWEGKITTPSPRATPETLMRRLSFLLTGLPPSEEELKSTMAEKDAFVFEKWVDHYLESKGFGERWARHWMDVVRYSETKGHEFDYEIQGAWKYRDYLIRAFRQDIPYQQLLKEHIAGDMLSQPREDENGYNQSAYGSVFWAMGEGTHSPVDLRKDESDRIDNMIDVVTKSFQGLTVACAKCHDHKFDPIPTKDYYALYGILEGTRFTPVMDGQQAVHWENLNRDQQIRKAIRKQFAEVWQPKAESKGDFQLTSNLEEEPKEVQVIGDFRGQSLDGWRSDGLAFGPLSTLGRPRMEAGKLMALEEGRASSAYFGKGKFGVLRSPDFVTEKDYIGVRAKGKIGTIRIVMDNFQLIRYPIYGGLEQRVNAEEWKDLVFDVSDWKGRKAYIEIFPGIYDRHKYIQKREDEVEVQFAITYDEEWKTPHLPKERRGRTLTEILKRWSEYKVTAPEVQKLNDWLKSGEAIRELPQLDKLIKKMDELEASFPDTMTFFNGVTEGFARESPVFIRGNHLELSEESVERRFLPEISGFTSSFESAGSGRMELAEAMLSPQNPLTARVMVNRIWHHLFGRGIVETVDNFGLQGTLPSHPELLDYLALLFVEEGWSIKKLIRHIVLSETFQRSAEPMQENSNVDASNILLSHFPIRRLEAEAIRDALLMVSGNLDTLSFGPPVAIHLTDFMQGRGRPAQSGQLDGNGRRSIYLEVRRNFLSHMLRTFDLPTPFTTFGRRDVTNVPDQSLLLMNDPFIIQQAEKMAIGLSENTEESLEERVTRIYRRAFARNPSQNEVVAAREFLRSKSKGEGRADLEAWKSYCHTIFNMKEFIYLL
ncbi:PSD1 and planctomycete cytochrome C domain-containing protein [Pleomorphovibrio marinus]|uniref:PSD1 and planctomycete cytochrome C domain-containing protein n=1 Tax=Pleomorphovibrio marinus TaxID=2164132 RepID=UPI001E649439|nr:PSD1 and planctomycete cytochrome C domain-containing protein [Pleomorphovibrio marinus]